MRVVLIATPVWATQTPPLTTAYLTSWLRAHGHEVLQLDWNIELFRDADAQGKRAWDRGVLHHWQDEALYAAEIAPRVTGPGIAAFADRVAAFEPQLIGLSAYSIQATLHLARTLAERLPGVPQVVGGQNCDPGVYAYPLAWSGLFEAVVTGEGEGPLLDLVDAFAAGRRDLAEIPGLLLPRGPRHAVETADRAPLADVDAIPWPAFDGLPMDAYTAAVEPPYTPSRSVSTLLARGCVRRCDFCLQAAIWRGFRHRDPDDVVDELLAHRAEHDLARVHFNDLLINGDPRRLAALCDRLIEVGWDLPWAGNAIVARSLDRTLLTKMRAAGCDKLGFGFESFSDPVLVAMGKHYTAADCARLLRDLDAVGMPFFSNLIIGHPAETRAEFRATVDFLRAHAARFTEPPTSSLLIIQRNTPLYRDRARWGIEMEPGDAFGWRMADGSNDVDERKRRARMMGTLYDELFGARIKITDLADDGL